METKGREHSGAEMVPQDQLIAVLRRAPGIAAAIERLAAKGDVFRIVVSEKNADLIFENAQGLVETALRDNSGRFVEQVKLERVPNGFAGILEQVAIQSALAEISEKLDQIAERLDSLNTLMNEAHRGGLQGAIDGLNAAVATRDKTDILSACRSVREHIGIVINQMGVNIKKMPDSKMRWRDGWSSSWKKNAIEAHGEVCFDLALIGKGMKPLIGAYLLLGEYESASIMMDGIGSQLDKAGLETARVRSRLLDWDSQSPPEAPFVTFIENRSAVRDRLRALHETPFRSVELQVRAAELVP